MTSQLHEDVYLRTLKGVTTSVSLSNDDTTLKRVHRVTHAYL